jgi:hypothetical protein
VKRASRGQSQADDCFYRNPSLVNIHFAVSNLAIRSNDFLFYVLRSRGKAKI